MKINKDLEVPVKSSDAYAQLHLKIPKELSSKLKQFAISDGLTCAQWITQALSKVAKKVIAFEIDKDLLDENIILSLLDSTDKNVKSAAM